MPYHMPNGLSYCIVDRKLIFLDIEKDQYMLVSGDTEKAFFRYTQGSASKNDISTLLDKDILAQTQGERSSRMPAENAYPTKSAIEEPYPLKAISTTALLLVAKFVFSTQLQLRTKKLQRVLDEMVARKHRLARRPQSAHYANTDERLLELSTVYLRARAYVPIERICLLDSISMISFLATRGFSANLVFGVAAQPFSAHCWVQCGAMVLNETVGYASAHTPIRVVS